MVNSQTVAIPRPWIERLPGAILSAVVIARLLTPTDAAPIGETLWIAQVVLLGLLAWGVAAFPANQVLLRFNWVDAVVGLFCLGHVIGSLAAIATSGDKRAAMTMLWEWVGLAVTWFLLRQQLGSAAERNGMLLVVAAAAVSLAGLGIWQHHFGYAEMRQEFAKLKAENAALVRAGRPNDPQRPLEWDRAMHKVRAEFARLDIPVDDSSRMLWEQRLYSSEPIGMFALANTLAGVLVCASILWLGMLVCAGRDVPAWVLALGGILTALILYCLLLTKSRTAFVGLAAGLGLWGAAELGFRRAEGCAASWPVLAAGAAIHGGAGRDCRGDRRPRSVGRFRIRPNRCGNISVRVLVVDVANADGFPAKLAAGGRARELPAELFAVQTPSIERRDRRPAQSGARRVGQRGPRCPGRAGEGPLLRRYAAVVECVKSRGLVIVIGSNERRSRDTAGRGPDLGGRGILVGCHVGTARPIVPGAGP